MAGFGGFADRVREQVSGFAGGTGAVTLPNSAVTGNQTFLAGWGASGTGFYTLFLGSQWEIGFGTLNAGGTQLTRTEPIAGSAGAATLVTFSAGTLDCWGDAPADFLTTRPTEDYVINGDGQVRQIALGSTADDVYSHDCWYALTQTAALTTSQLADVEDGVPNMIRLTQGQASAQRIGYAQIIESARCKKLRGKRFTIGGRLRYSNAAAVRFAILEWTSTADTVTSDVVNDWTSSTYTAGNFFAASNVTVRAVGSLTPAAATLQDFRLSATLGSSVNNLIVMIWTEGTAAQNSTLDFVMQGKRGFAVHPIVMRSLPEELVLCQRYFEKSYNIATALGTAAAALGVITRVVPSNTVASFQGYGTVNFNVRKRLDPTVTIYGYAGGSGKVSDNSGTDLAASSGLVQFAGESGFSIYNGSGGSVTTSNLNVLFHFAADARL